MPTREGFYSGGGGQRAASGLFTGLSSFGHILQDEQLKEKASQRTLAREEAYKRYQEAQAKVNSGELTPEEAAKYAGNGAKPEHFAPFVPSQATTLSKLNDVLKPDTTTEEANVRMHALAPFRKLPDLTHDDEIMARVPNMFDAAPLDQQSLVGKIGDLLRAKSAKSDEDAPVTKIGETASVGPTFGQQSVETETGGRPEMPFGGDVQPQSIFGRFNKRTQSMQEVGRVNSGPSAGQKGQATGIEAASAAPGQGNAQKLIEDTLRPAKVETARAEQQSRIDTDTSVPNTAKKARSQSTIEYATTRARDKAMQDGVDPAIANTFLRSTSTDHPFANIPANTPKEVAQVAMNMLSAKVPGIRFVNPQQLSALESIETARANYQNVIDLLNGHLAKDYQGNALRAPRNWIATAVKADPQLAAALSDFPQTIQALRAQAGQFGRITQQEIFRAVASFPQITDPWDNVVTKRGLFYNSLENAENGILGLTHPKAGR